MNDKAFTYCTLILLIFSLISCGIDSRNKSVKEDLIHITVDSLPQTGIQPEEPVNDENILKNESSEDKLKRIKKNTKRINSIKNWSLIDKKELRGTTLETSKGGIAKFYYQDEQLEKIVTQQFDKTFQLFTEYYLLNGQLSFVHEKSQIYICAYTVSEDSLEWVQNKDVIISDINTSKWRESSEYFENGELFQRIVQDIETYSPFDSEWLMTRYKRRQTDFEDLIKLAKIKS
jgi:hypothetical protein